MDREFTCERCGLTFKSGWTQEEAEAEMRENFGEIAESDRVVVCDPCYRLITAQFPPAEFQKMLVSQTDKMM